MALMKIREILKKEYLQKDIIIIVSSFDGQTRDK